jgi:protein ImuA
MVADAGLAVVLLKVAAVALRPDLLIEVSDADILPAMEEGLRVKGFAGFVGELKRLPMTPSQRSAGRRSTA